MLRKLRVKNWAIISDITVEFDLGMTVITGQTGAGKSLLIDSLDLLLGKRADIDMIRHGEDYAVVEGYFDNLSKTLLDVLAIYDIKAEDTLVITRELSLTGRNVVRINNKAVFLTQLKQIGLSLGDIHVQNDTYRLINKDTYLTFLDDYADKSFLRVFNDYQKQLMIFDEAKQKLSQAKKKSEDAFSRLDLYKMQRKEIMDVSPMENEDAILTEEIAKLLNFDTIYQALWESHEALNSNALIDTIYSVSQTLKKISEFDDEYKQIHEETTEAYYLLDDANQLLGKVKALLDFDPALLAEKQQRLSEIDSLKKKYQMSVEQINIYLEEITEATFLIENYDQAVKELQENCSREFELTLQKGLKLTDYRRKKAEFLSSELCKIALELDLENISFTVSFADLSHTIDNPNFYDTGLDEIDFLVTLNKGEPLKPLAKIASGGELSRIMLAFKSILIRTKALSFIVFDEIDSGLSGKAALKLSQKIKDMSLNVQTLCITHLPAVAAKGDNHIRIAKEELHGRTFTVLKKLSIDERVIEIAQMLSGDALSTVMIATARELLK